MGTTVDLGVRLALLKRTGVSGSNLIFSFIPMAVFGSVGGSTVVPTGSVFRPTGNVSRRVGEGLCKIHLGHLVMLCCPMELVVLTG